ncbi:MAG: pyruvate dehydrogenase complex E1 component subunit beta [Rhodobacterales bacterium TMED271]|nr:MAG: pyruvate dehydrogenase complex E1 component subunit beta [Rhodobacterales bacterium TMED271]|tara:strand:+ start:224 stop:1612 length:1389 start_codon:yes stop_codon:yes gene_type:complete
MKTEILMPSLSPTMEEGSLAKWYVSPGDKVKPGDIIADIETDKALMEYESIEEGTILDLLVEEGTENIKVNSLIAIIETEGSEGIEQKKDIDLNQNEPALFDKSDQTSQVKTEANVISRVDDKEKNHQELNENSSTKQLTVREAINSAIAEEMKLDENVFLMGEEVGEYQGAYKVSQGLLEEFGSNRVIDTPITEHGFTGLAVGAAFSGIRPIVEFMTFNFAMQALDQIVNSAAKTNYMSGGQINCPIVFRGPNGAAARVAAQHSQDFASLYASIPGLKVIQPFSAEDAKGLLKAAIRENNPVVFLENEILYGKSFPVNISDDQVIPIGKAKTVSIGKDVTIISYGIGMMHTLEANIKLKELGISAEVIDLRTIRPIDFETIIESVKKTNRCVTVEESFPVCSIGSYVGSQIMIKAFDYLDAPVLNCTGKDVPMPYAENLEKAALTSPDEIISAVKKVLYKN